MYHYVYVTTNKINSKYYVGVHSTHYDPSTSWDGYLGSGTVFNQAIEKYGKENFDHRVIAQFATRDLAFEAEIVYIAQCIDDLMCYNVALGGKGDWNKTLEAWRKRDPDAYYAHVHSASEKASKSMKEVWANPEFRERHSRIMKEVMADPKVRKNMSNAAKNNGKDPKYRKSQSETAKKVWKDPEFRERHSRIMADPKVRKNMSNAMKEKWADPKYREKLEKIHSDPELSVRRSKSIRAAPLSLKNIQHHLKQCRSGIGRISKLKSAPARMKDLEDLRLREQWLLKQIAEYQTNDQ